MKSDLAEIASLFLDSALEHEIMSLHGDVPKPAQSLSEAGKKQQSVL